VKYLFKVLINSVNIRKTQRKKRVLFFIVLTFKEKNVHIPRLMMEKKKSSLYELQSLLGKLHFVATCVRPGRLSVSRLLNWLRSVFPSNIVGSGHRNFRTIPTEVTKKIKYFFLERCHPKYELLLQC
jgi:hypothetical protein